MGTSTSAWVAEKILELDHVEKCEVIDEVLIRAHRKGLPPTEIACIRVNMLDGAVIRTAIRRYPDVEFILNLPRTAHTTGDGYRAAAEARVACGGLGDAYRALRLDNPSQYVHPETMFIERILRQHSAIKNFERVDDNRYAIHRRSLPPVVACIENAYEITAEAIRNAVDRYGAFDAYVSSNPHANTVSPQAAEVAEQVDRKIYTWRQFMAMVGEPW